MTDETKSTWQINAEQAERVNKQLAEENARLRAANVALEIKFLEAHSAAAQQRIEYLKATNV